MFRSNFFLSIRQTENELWQPVMLSRAYLDPDEDPIWAAGDHYSERHQAEQAARRWVESEGVGYEFIAPGEVPV